MRVKSGASLLKKALWVFSVVVVLVMILNHQTISDFVRGRFYSPSSEMIQVRENLHLTSFGRFIFDASRPEFNKEADFNDNCSSYSEDEIVLGCYTGKQIYVYAIDSTELEGILELTTAHELLHAVYERLSEGEKQALGELLGEVYRQNQGVLAVEIGAYGEKERAEELYVRAGTEIKQLPEALEEHYAKIFEDQDRVVDFYEGYAGVFRQLETELTALRAEMGTLKTQIDSKSLAYNNRVGEFESEVNEFNACASRAGCFSGDEEFYTRRNALLSAQAEIVALYDEIDNLIAQYNLVVEEYNQNVVRGETLKNLINSHVVVEGLDAN